MPAVSPKEPEVSVTIIKDLAKAVREQEEQKRARQRDEAADGANMSDPPAGAEPGSPQGSSTSEKNDKNKKNEK
jgi:hypothetical protein